ncbi:type II secretion system F family protein [Candidatus Woesearchaeota archaeon]|nr:type II secretion system F family protein [Candidatus Woesearchaeota archaeon]
MTKNIVLRALESAGWDVQQRVLEKRLFHLALVINFIIVSFIVFRYGFQQQFPVLSLSLMAVLAWIIAFFFVLSGCWFFLFVTLDLISYQRRTTMEEVLPDFLQLAAANLRAGMTPDRALWYAVRPKFGVLADEIGVTAKEVMTGDDLGVALTKLSRRYDSQTLRRSINLLIEGLDAGGDLADILNNVAINIQETRILNKEMSANILTYVIFIASAVMFAAPFLLALSLQLLTTLTAITSSIDVPSGASLGLFSLSTISIAPDDFKNFALIMLTITSFFSAMIVAIIQKGSIEGGVKYIPLFIGTSLVVFFLAAKFFGTLLGSIAG